MATPPLSDELCQQAVDAYEQCGKNGKKTAKHLNIPRGTFANRMRVAKQRGISSTQSKIETLHGHNPEHDLTHIVPSPLILRGTSSLYGKDGELKLQWVKSKLSDQKLEETMKAAISAMAESIPRVEPINRPDYTNSALCNLYVITDAHVGSRSWGEETGEDWDLDIAERTLVSAFSYLLESSPNSETCVIAQLGDYLHYSGIEPATETSHNILDADSRFSKMVRVAIRVLRTIISKALEKHTTVYILMGEGNHDISASVWLRHLFTMLYENELRIKVINSEMPYYVHQHGQTMLGFHHGHLKKNDGLPLLFAAQFPKIWGNTTKRYVHTGHRHHEEIKEHSGIKVIQHSTLTARDAYAARGGWFNERQIVSTTYHVKYGQVATITVIPEMLEDEK